MDIQLDGQLDGLIDECKDRLVLWVDIIVRLVDILLINEGTDIYKDARVAVPLLQDGKMGRYGWIGRKH